MAEKDEEIVESFRDQTEYRLSVMEQMIAELKAQLESHDLPKKKKGDS